jgi:hypothetical protein
VPEIRSCFDVEETVERARSLWRYALDCSEHDLVELFVKVASRIRVARDIDPSLVESDTATETGLAVRTFRRGLDRAGFATTSGLSNEGVRWAVNTATRQDARVMASAPTPDSVPSARWDLELPSALPSREALIGSLETHPHLEWGGSRNDNRSIDWKRGVARCSNARSFLGARGRSSETARCAAWIR